jgi:hypothetical protein
MDANEAQQNDYVEELVYHVKRTITNFAEDSSGAPRVTDILGTFTNLISAKNAAHSALAMEGYTKNDFEVYEVKDETDPEEWKHGDGCLVFAKVPRGQEFDVRIDTKPNVLKLKGNTSGEVKDSLYYVLQTTINYNTDRIGGNQHTEVEGTYHTKTAAFEAAQTALLNEEITKESFAEYDEKEQFEGEWPYGDEVLIRAVAETGENFYLTVKAQLHSHI